MNLFSGSETVDRLAHNQDTYDRLYVSLVDGLGTLQILVAVCGSDRQREALIQRLGQELEEEARCLRVVLPPGDPNLKGAIEAGLNSVDREAWPRCWVTVSGVEGFNEQAVSKFLGFLQWTREGLRALALPIVLWLPESLVPRLAKQSPDFWSWRNGVFIFQREQEEIPAGLDSVQVIFGGHGFQVNATQEQPIIQIQGNTALNLNFVARTSLFSVEQLEDSLERAIAQWGADSPKVAPLYAQLGEAYGDRFKNGRCVDREREVARGVELLQKAIALQANSPQALALSLNNLAELYESMGRYEEALPLHQRSLAIREQELGSNHPDTASSLNNLAALYESMGRYEEVLPLYRRAVEIATQTLGPNHPNTQIFQKNLQSIRNTLDS